MALNFSSYATFPASNRSDDGFGSMDWGGGAGSCASSCWMDWDRNDFSENGGGKDWVDPVDLLPADPFGMELTSNLAAAIVGWFEGLGVKNSKDCRVYCWDGWDEHDRLNAYGGDWYEDPGVRSGDCRVYCWDGWNEDCQKDAGGQFGGGFCEVEWPGEEDGGDAFRFFGGDEEIPSSSELDMGIPREVMMLSLGYLGLHDLLTAEMVCRSFHSAVQNEFSLWKCIHIESPLSEKITDEALLSLTLRAQENLQCLSLVGCLRITDEGLKKVLKSCPKLQKLSVSGCLRLSMEGVISNLKAMKSSGMKGIKQLRLGRLCSVSMEQYEELQMLLGDEVKEPKPYKSRFYHCDVSSIACEDEYALDTEMCPQCKKVKMVFDCPSERCRGMEPEKCRACSSCIQRCVHCGRCEKGSSFDETFSFDNLCAGCQKNSGI